LSHGRKIDIVQRTKAESDVAVAAASILAREAFVGWLDRQGKTLGLQLGRGVSAGVKATAEKLAAEKGPEILRQVAKVHFRTAHVVAPKHFAAPPVRGPCPPRGECPRVPRRRSARAPPPRDARPCMACQPALSCRRNRNPGNDFAIATPICDQSS